MTAHEQITGLILQHRKVLFAYILAIVRDYHLAEDVFQEVSLVLVRKYQDFKTDGDFWRVAREIARRQALVGMRKNQRIGVLLSEESLDLIDSGFDEVVAEGGDREEALSKCLKLLPFGWRDIVRMRFWDNLGVQEIAASLNKTENTISVTLNRIRGKLADCVKTGLRKEIFE